MGMRLPGGIRHDEELYNFLIEQKDARSIVPPIDTMSTPTSALMAKKAQ